MYPSSYLGNIWNGKSRKNLPSDLAEEILYSLKEIQIVMKIAELAVQRPWFCTVTLRFQQIVVEMALFPYVDRS